MAKIIQFQYVNQNTMWFLDDEGDIWCREFVVDKFVWHILYLPEALYQGEEDDDAISA